MIPNCKQVKNRLNKLENNNVYSTEEKIVGKWIDGKLLYRKTIVLKDGTGQTSPKAYNLSDFGINNAETIFLMYPSYYTVVSPYDSTEKTVSFFNYYDGNKFLVEITKATTLFVTLGYEYICNNETVITLEYTKTTD